MIKNKKNPVESHSRIILNVPLFHDGKNDFGMKIEIQPQFGAWSFSITADDPMYDTLLSELFAGLCLTNKMRQKLFLAVKKMRGKNSCAEDHPYTIGSMDIAGDFFKYGEIFQLIAEIFIPHWQCVASRIMAFDRGNGWNDTISCALKHLGTWKVIDQEYVNYYRWERKQIEAEL